MKLHTQCAASAILALAFCILALAGGLPAQAVPVTANTTADLIADLTAAQTSGATVANPYVINLASDVTYTISTVNNTSADFGDNGLPVITLPVTINGNDATITRSAAPGTPEFRLLQCSAAALKLNAVTLSNGLADDPNDNLTAAMDGGALEITGASCAVSLLNCTLSGNNSSEGGAICDDGGGTLNLNGCTLMNNNVTSVLESSFGAGGAIACDSDVSSLSIAYTTLQNNTAGWGGGAAVFSATATSIEGSIVTANNVEGLGIGGAIALTGTAQNAIDTTSIYQNTAGDCPGAGIYNTSPLSVVTNCDITNDTASGLVIDGGGIYNTGNIILTNDVIGADLATSDTQFPSTGGGMQNNGTATITNCTFDENGPNAYASSGAASSATFLNCILYGDAGPELNLLGGSVATVTFSDVMGGAVGTGNIDEDPLLAPTLANNGGQIESQELTAGSPAFSAGSPLGAPATDMRGAPRPNPPSMGSFDSGTAPSVLQLQPPLIFVGSGTYTSAQSVTIIDAYGPARIYYTTDGSSPSITSTLYSGPITVSSTETITAFAVANGFTSSANALAAYNLGGSSAVPNPTFSVAAGTYSSPQLVMLSDTLPGALIYYTTDGSAPSTSSILYGGTAITVSSSEQLNAIAVASGHPSSAVSTASYAIVVASWSAGIQMVSLPYAYPTTSLSTLFGYTSPVLAVWNPGTSIYSVTPTPPADQIRLGQGYWIRLPQATTISLIGTPAPAGTPLDVPIVAGWNMVGDPWTSSVDLTSLKFNQGTETYAQANGGSNQLIGNIFGYSTTTKAYFYATSFVPGQGYWLYSFAATDMQIPPPSN